MLDAIPDPILVVDEQIRIIGYNAAAARLVGGNPTLVLRRRGGEVLHCMHSSESPQGCGQAAACADCVIRDAVRRACAGTEVRRRAFKLQLQRGSEIEEVHTLVTTAPIQFGAERLALLVLEDVSELVALRGIVPICANCHKVRDDDQYWDNVESYFKRQLDIDFSHGICPDCVRRLYPDLGELDAPATD